MPDQDHRTSGRLRHVAAAAFVFVVCMVGTTLPTSLYGLYQREIGFSALMVTVVFAVYAVGVIGALVLAGGVSDAVGRRPVLQVGLLFSGASALCFLLQDGLPLLFAGRLLSGLSAGLFTGAATVAVVELAPHHSRSRAGFVATAANMGGLGCGPLLSGVLAEYAPHPLHLTFVVDLALVVAALLLTLAFPETVTTRRATRSALRPRMPRVPAHIRGLFVPAALAGFAGFSLLGLFTSVSTGFMAGTLGVHDLAVSGLVVFVVFAASTLGQLALPVFGVRRALPVGCGILVAGLALLAGSLLAGSLALLVAGAVVGGTGQGLAFRGGLTTVTRAAPQDRRGEVTSAFFVVAYLGISLPVVGVGALAQALGLRGAGLVFAAFMGLLAAAIGVTVLRRPPRS